MNDSAFLCLDCGVDTLDAGEYYMVRDELWEAAGGEDGMLCVGCLEGRLGRPLGRGDFADVLLNFDPPIWASHSARLRARIAG